MIKKVAFTLYPVNDLKRAQNFYEQVLQLPKGKESPMGGYIEYDLPQGGCFAITTLAEGVKPDANAGGSVAFEVDNLPELLDELKGKGVKVKLDTFSTPVCDMAVILDSEGNALVLHQLKRKN